MDLHEILEALDIAAKKEEGYAVISKNLAEDARDALQMLAAGREKRTGDADSHNQRPKSQDEIWSAVATPQVQAPLLGMTGEGRREKVGEAGVFRYDPNAYAGALVALENLRKATERPEDREAVRLLLEAVAEKAEREYPDRFRRIG